MPDIYNYYSPMEALNRELMSTDLLSDGEKGKIVPCGYGHMAEGDIQISIAVNDD